MMRILFTIMALTLNFSSYADCLDMRYTRLSPCPDGQERQYVKGECEKEHELETYYCADIEEPGCLSKSAFFSPSNLAELEQKFIQSPCPIEYELRFIQGRCEKGEFEHHYCF